MFFLFNLHFISFVKTSTSYENAVGNRKEYSNMVYGKIKKLLPDNQLDSTEIVLIESPFLETSRSGKYLRSVILGLTNANFAIASMVYCVKFEKNEEDTPKYDKQLKLYYLYSLDVIKIYVFKQHMRNSIKAVTTHGVRYFEMASTPKKKIFWDLWCSYIQEINSKTRLWPFNCTSDVKIRKPTWLDKHLFLGEKRAIEDKNRPVPVPGLGDNVEVKSLYVKPQYFGHWDESEYWVQCGYNAMISEI